MIHAIQGIVIHSFENEVIVKSDPIEWQLETSTRCSTSLTNGEEVRLLTYLHHKEDILALFGFIDEDERHCFHSLIKVNGVGPKQAIKILSGISPRELYQALEEENLQRMTQIPGLGTKTAQKIFLKLQGSLVKPKADQKPSSNELRDILEALSNMGYDKKHAQTVLETIIQREGEGILSNESELMRRVIIELS